jgi:hypothetical protein
LSKSPSPVSRPPNGRLTRQQMTLFGQPRPDGLGWVSALPRARPLLDPKALARGTTGKRFGPKPPTAAASYGLVRFLRVPARETISGRG